MANYHVTVEVKVVEDDPQSTASERCVVGVDIEAPTMRGAAERFQRVLQALVDRCGPSGRWVWHPGILQPPPGADLSKIGDDDG